MIGVLSGRDSNQRELTGAVCHRIVGAVDNDDVSGHAGMDVAK
jgi:hypothetical protein